MMNETNRTELPLTEADIISGYHHATATRLNEEPESLRYFRWGIEFALERTQQPFGVTDEMVERACIAAHPHWDARYRDDDPVYTDGQKATVREQIRAALEAALREPKPREGTPKP
jgi:hypothetical protein